jgi:hypothetical protein
MTGSALRGSELWSFCADGKSNPFGAPARGRSFTDDMTLASSRAVAQGARWVGPALGESVGGERAGAQRPR